MEDFINEECDVWRESLMLLNHAREDELQMEAAAAGQGRLTPLSASDSDTSASIRAFNMAASRIPKDMSEDALRPFTAR